MEISPASLYNPRNLKQLTRRLRSLGLSSRHARRLCYFVHRQVLNRGIGAIPYLKRIGNAILSYVTGEVQDVKWVAIRNGFPAQLEYLKEYPRAVLFRLTRAHAFVTLGSVTKEQATKFMAAVQTPPPSDESLRSAQSLIGIGVDRFHMSSDTVKLCSMPLALIPLQRQAKTGWMSTLSKKRRSAASIEASGKMITRSLDYLASPIWFDVLSNKHVMDAFYPLDKGYFSDLSQVYSHKLHHAPTEAQKLVEKFGLQRLQPSLVGNLGMTQEPGGKLRVFASPYLVWQAVCEPLGVTFLNLLKRQVSQDCTHKQEEGALWAQAQLQAGKQLHSVDLSNATDLFPLKLQEICLNQKFGVDGPMRDIFLRVARGNWKVPKAIQEFGYPEEVKWERGQPLGLKPSFGLFAFTHHMLIQGICHVLGIDLDAYRVLGDDVIFSDLRLSHTYIAIMEEIGCKIAHEKSILSSKMAEFAGYRITPTDCIRPGKFRKLSLTNAVEVAKALGSDLRHEVTGALSSFLSKYLSLPKDMGGADLNLSDCSELIMAIEETRAEKLRDCAGDLLERRCAGVILASGLVTRIPEFSLKNSRFTQFVEVINLGLEKRYVSRLQIKQFGVNWAIGTVEACEKAQLCDRSRGHTSDTALRIKYGIPLSADLTTASRRLNGYFQKYYASSSNLSNHQILIEWMKKGYIEQTNSLLLK